MPREVRDRMALELIRRLWPQRHEHPFIRKTIRGTIGDLRLLRQLRERSSHDIHELDA